MLATLHRPTTTTTMPPRPLTAEATAAFTTLFAKLDAELRAAGRR